jgi:hypothetical protein
MARIYPKEINGNTYYYFQKSYREKKDPAQKGKTKGSGKSRVRSDSIYLGTAESIFDQLKKNKKPIEAHHREFGFVAAAYQTAARIGLVDLLKDNIEGERRGIPRWLYFMLTIINRLDLATSKAQMGKWAQKTVLPDLLSFDPTRLDSKSFWYATDDVISEKKLCEKREKNPELDDELFAGIDDDVFKKIELSLFKCLRDRFELNGNAILYDTTNFFTYIEEPPRSKLARTGHNKDCRHHLKQIGLAMCVEKEWGIPLFHRIYRGNSHDSKTFTELIDDLIGCMRAGFDQVENLVLVMDKGNNSEKNFIALKDKIRWVGSLVPSHFPKLIELPLDRYTGVFELYRYYKCVENVMGIDCALVMTYNDKLARKQEHSMQNGIKKLKQQIIVKWNEYKRKPAVMPSGILSMMKESRYGKYIEVKCEGGAPAFSNTTAVDEARKRFGKNLLFSGDTEADPSWVIMNYHDKNRVEESFKLLKDPQLIRFRPMRHWTDTKIRAFGFCCVMSLILIRVMMLIAAEAGIGMSAAVLKTELSDLRQIIMVYDAHNAEVEISNRSSIQQRLCDLFDLNSLIKHLTIHN